MASNRLLLNGDKTQYIWFGTKQQLGKRDVQLLTDISPALTSTSVVRNLGVLLDSELTMVNHVTKLCQVCFSNSDGCARCDVRSHRMWRSHWSTPPSAPGSITAIVPCTASQLQLRIVCSRSSTLLPGWFSVFRNTGIFQQRYVTASIGFPSGVGSSFAFVCSSVTHSLVLLRHTWWTSACHQAAFQVAGTCARLARATLLCHLSGESDPVAGAFPWLVRAAGTVCLQRFVV